MESFFCVASGTVHYTFFVGNRLPIMLDCSSHAADFAFFNSADVRI